MIRRLLSLLSLLLIVGGSLFAQSGGNKITESPQALPEEACNFSIYGLSPNGRYIYGGSPSSTAFCYDTEKKVSTLFVSEDGSTRYRIYAVTNDGKLFLSKDDEGTIICDMDKKTLQTLQSPLAEYPDVIPAYVTPNGKHLVGYMMDPSFAQESMTVPIYGSCGEDGTWTLQLLPMLATDYFKEKPNYTQAFFCSPDGKKILGRQNTNTGTDRPLYWVLDEAGKYQCTTPADAYLYNLDAPLPGPMPEWEDYVTADYEKEPEKYEEQEAKYNEAYEKWEKERDAVLKNVFTDLTWQEMATASGYWMISIQELKGEGEDITSVSYPGALNVHTGLVESLNIPEAYRMGGLGRTADGGWICYPDGNNETKDFNSYVIYPDGKKVSMIAYLKDLTGSDLTDYFTYTYTPYGSTEPITATDIGTVHFSADGKTLTSCAINMAGTPYNRNAFLRLENSFLAKPTGTTPLLEGQQLSLAIQWHDNALHFSEPQTGVLYLFDTAGSLIYSYTLKACSKVAISELPQSVYIAQLVTTQGTQAVRFVF